MARVETAGTLRNTATHTHGEQLDPNPANDKLFIEASATVSCVIRDMQGRIVMSVSEAKQVDISSLPNNVYMIGLFDSNGLRLKTERLVVLH